jgi:hypothetical protein
MQLLGHVDGLRRDVVAAHAVLSVGPECAPPQITCLYRAA